MRKSIFIILAIALILGFASCRKATEEARVTTFLNTDTEKISYSIGVNMGKSITNLDSLNLDLLFQGIRDMVDSNDILLTEMEQQESFKILQKRFEEKQKTENDRLYGKTRTEGENFLAENAKRPEVISLPSGLQYEVVKEGNGATPGLTDQVTVHYHGTLVDGTVFDSSVDRGESIQFPVNGVIPGWTEALQLMSEGDKWKVYIPYNLAYGERGSGGKIPPFSALIFDVELISVDS